jgi:hypothetical protein
LNAPGWRLIEFSDGEAMNKFSKIKSTVLEIRDALHLLHEIEENLRAVREIADSLRRIQGFGELGQDPVGIVRQRASDRSAAFIEEHLENASLYFSRQDLWNLAFSRINNSGLILEFGVHAGESVNFFATKTSRQIHGFDSFVGLPENWHGTPLDSGAFNLNGKLPAVADNVKLHKGWFSETLDDFLLGNPEPVSLIHIDSDLYSSAKYILETLNKRFVSGSLILFDEHHGYPDWENGEFKALNEFGSHFGVTYRYLGFAQQAALVEII